MDARAAYLDLLKRSLCDLLTPHTESLVPAGDSELVAVPLSDADLDKRVTGRDWPVNGTTMVGLRRLDHVQESVEAVVREKVPGDLIETGVWRGGASMMMQATLRSLDVDDRDIWLADSFEGLPRSSPDLYPDDAGSDEHFEFAFLSASEEDVRRAFERHGLLDAHVRFHPGWFSDSLPPLRGHHRWSLLRLDGDMYESTIVALESLYPDLSVGGFVIVDDYGAIPQCRQAVHDFREANGIEDEIREIDWTGVYWRRRS